MNEEESLHKYDSFDAVWVKKYRTNQLRVGGVINPVTCLQLRKDGEGWIDRLSEKYQSIEIDMEPSKPQGSVCISLMLCWLRHSKRKNISLEFHNVPQDIEKIIQMSGVFQLFDIKSVKKKPYRNFDID